MSILLYYLGGKMYFDKINDIVKLKKEYRKLVMIHHPDVGGREETIKVINNAYSERYIYLQNNENNTNPTPNDGDESDNNVPIYDSCNFFYDEDKLKYIKVDGERRRKWEKEASSFQNKVLNLLCVGSVLKHTSYIYYTVVKIEGFYSNYSSSYWRIHVQESDYNGKITGDGGGFFRVLEEDFDEILNTKKIMHYEIISSPKCKRIA